MGKDSHHSLGIRGMETKQPEVNKGIAYVLWAVGFFAPVCGLQRFYTGRPVSGTFYFFTLGFFYIGQILDVFFIPSMVDERNRYLTEKTKRDVFVTLVSPPPTIAPPPPSKPSDPMIQLLQAAANHKNMLSVGQAMLALQMSQEQTEKLLMKAMRQGLAHVDNDPETGAVRYYFDI